MDNRVSTDSREILGNTLERPESSAIMAMNVPPTESTQSTRGLTHKRSLILLMKKTQFVHAQHDDMPMIAFLLIYHSVAYGFPVGWNRLPDKFSSR